MEDNQVMSLKDWIITLVILCIPCVNIVMLFIWGFSSTGNANRANFCKAQLIIVGVILVLYLIVGLLFGASLAAMMGSLANY